jgi:serine/threonine-protein kinase
LNEVNAKEEVKNESFKKESFEAVKPDRTKYFILAGIVAVALMGFFLITNQKIVMEDIVGWNVSDAKAWASANEVQLVVSEVYNETPAQTILTQSVLEGEKISAKSSIQVDVSLGYDPKEIIVLPSFDETWTKTRILTWLEENGITNYTFINEENESLISGTLLSYETPETVTDYLREQDIEFTVSILPVEEEIVVVDFLAYSTAQIDAWASENEVKVYYRSAYSDTITANKVLSQSLSAGEIMNPGDSITITLSNGPSVKMVYFADYDQVEAATWAKDNGIDLTISTAYSSVVAKNVAIYQSIPADTIVGAGTNLNLVYSLGSEVLINSYVNQPLVALQSYVDAQNALGAGLTLNVSTSYSSTVPLNKIISQSTMDAKVGIGSTLNVVVSLGDLSIVPDLLALNTTNASATALEMYNLVSATCTSSDIICQIVFADDDTLAGDVISQSLAAGTQVSDTTVLQVIIAD